jgi:hypothetical protein
MKKTILTIAGSALVVLSAVQFAAAKEQNQRSVRHRTTVTEFRNSNAFVAPTYESEPEAYRYSGGWSAPAGR